jgi:hypothetical protein
LGWNLGREPGLVQEHGDERRILQQVRVQHLDGDRPREAALAEHATEVDARHAAARDLAEQEVAPEPRRNARRRSGCEPALLGGHRHYDNPVFSRSSPRAAA